MKDGATRSWQEHTSILYRERSRNCKVSFSECLAICERFGWSGGSGGGMGGKFDETRLEAITHCGDQLGRSPDCEAHRSARFCRKQITRFAALVMHV